MYNNKKRHPPPPPFPTQWRRRRRKKSWSQSEDKVGLRVKFDWNDKKQRADAVGWPDTRKEILRAILQQIWKCWLQILTVLILSRQSTNKHHYHPVFLWCMWFTVKAPFSHKLVRIYCPYFLYLLPLTWQCMCLVTSPGGMTKKGRMEINQ
jgi:hypothetical protein